MNINAPLWYFTAIIFYYLLFPVFFSKKHPILSALGIFLITSLVMQLPLPIDPDVISLYRVHDAAFPIGIILAALVAHDRQPLRRALERVRNTRWLNPLLLVLLSFGIWYTAVFSGVGKGLDKEQFIAMLTTLMAVFFFYLKKFRVRLLHILGVLAYEVYLIHWPIVYRYDVFYPHLPVWLATAFYLGFFMGVAYLLQRITSAVFQGARRAREGEG